MTAEPDGNGRRSRRGGQGPRHGRQGRGIGVVLPAIAGVLAMGLVLTGGYAVFAYGTLSGSLTKVDAIIHPGSKGDDVDGEAQNILLVGDDHRPDGATDAELQELGTESDGGATNTDTMIVLHIDADGKAATMISFPRDSYVDIPGYGKGKLNSAFSLGSQNGGGPAGGAQLLIKSIQELSGLQIDHYVRVSLLGFYQIVQQLGPVSVCLNNPVQDHYSGIDLPAGVSELSPKQALAFVRQRHGLPEGDLDRQKRQQYFLSQEARKILSAGTLLNPVKTTQVLKTIGNSIETDQGLDMLSLANQMRDLRPSAIRSATIPTLGTPTIYVNGQALSIVEVDTAGMPAFIQSLVGAPQAYTDAEAADPTTVQVTVLNGSGVTGGAAAAGQTLAARGFQVGAPGSSTNTASTVVEYPAGMEAQAKAVVAATPGATAVQTGSVTGVTLLLGTDGVVPEQPSAPAGSSDPAEPSDPAAPDDGAQAPDASTPAAPSDEPAAPKPTKAGNAYGAEGVCIN